MPLLTHIEKPQSHRAYGEKNRNYEKKKGIGRWNAWRMTRITF